MDNKLYIILFLIAKIQVVFLAEGECLLYADDPSDYVERTLGDYILKQPYEAKDIRGDFSYSWCFISFVREAFNPSDFNNNPKSKTNINAQNFYNVSKWVYVKNREGDCNSSVKGHLLSMIYLLMEAAPTDGVLSIKEPRMVAFGQLLNKMATKILMKKADKELAERLSSALDSKVNPSLVFTEDESANFRNNIGKVNMDLLTLFLQQMVVVSKKGLLQLKSLDNFNASLEASDDEGNDLRTLFNFVYAGNMRRKNDKEKVALTGADMSRKVFALYVYWLIYKVDRSSRKPLMENFMNRRMGEAKKENTDPGKPKGYLDSKNLNLNKIPKMTLAVLILKAMNENLGAAESSFIENIRKAYTAINEDQDLCPDKIVPLESKIEEFIKNGTITEETLEKTIAIDNESTMPTLFSGLTAMISGGTTMLNNAGKAATDIGKVSKALQYMINNPVSAALIPRLPIPIPVSAIEQINSTLEQMSNVEGLSSYGDTIKNTLGSDILETDTTDKEKKVNVSPFALLKAVITLAPLLAGTLTPAGVPVAVASGLAKLLIDQIQANDTVASALFGKSIGNLSDAVQSVLGAYNSTSNANGDASGATGSNGPPPVPPKDSKNPIPVPPKDKNGPASVQQKGSNGPPPVPAKDSNGMSRTASKDSNGRPV
ncbi:hypothetical protein DdX_14407 [Ditylenchus destructor]|uniref:Uncharacterized protein n=1 Tax=Ditylenchus destructor TaxID=166010 RepID=A0AAD4MR51_9BILA|nr:hypothetical protein DdX_14407 [Ditylenchus destructor]